MESSKKFPVLASYCCYNKALLLPISTWLKTTESYSFTVLEGRSPKPKFYQALGRMFPWLFLVFGSCQCPWWSVYASLSLQATPSSHGVLVHLPLCPEFLIIRTSVMFDTGPTLIQWPHTHLNLIVSAKFSISK